LLDRGHPGRFLHFRRAGSPRSELVIRTVVWARNNFFQNFGTN